MYTLFAQSVFLKTNSSLHKTHRITSDGKKSNRKKNIKNAVLSCQIWSILTLLKFNDDYKKCLKITVETGPSYWRTQREKPQNHRAWFGIIPQLRSLCQLSYLITHLNKIMLWKSVTLMKWHWLTDHLTVWLNPLWWTLNNNVISKAIVFLYWCVII